MVGRGGGAVNGTAGSLLNTGIPGMSGNPDMRYTGVVRMRGMPYRSVPSIRALRCIVHEELHIIISNASS